MRVWWVVPAFVAAVTAGCTSTSDGAAGLTPRAPSPAEQFITEARGTSIGQGTDAEVLALGEHACSILSNPSMTIDSAGGVFAIVAKVPRADAVAFFRSAARHLCPDQP